MSSKIKGEDHSMKSKKKTVHKIPQNRNFPKSTNHCVMINNTIACIITVLTEDSLQHMEEINESDASYHIGWSLIFFHRLIRLSHRSGQCLLHLIPFSCS